jgi:transcriptional regulator with XRE-family HTH domain
MSFEINQQIGANIASARREAGLTQGQLGRLAAIRQGDLCRLERGHYAPHLATLVKLAAALGVSAADLLEGVG